MSKSKYETHVEPYIDLIKSMRIDGHTEEQIYDYLGVSHTSWEKYKNNHIEITEALKISKEGLVAKLEQTLFQKALEGNPTLLIFALKNLASHRWADRQQIETNMSDDFVKALKDFVKKV